MFGVDDAIIAAGVSAVGQGVGSWLSGSSAKDAQDVSNRANATLNWENREWAGRENATNRAWQEMMSNTAWQRSVADMKAAGINPLLAVSKGGASTPGGSSISGTSSAQSQAAANRGLGEGISKASAVLQMGLQNELIKSQIAANSAQAIKTKAEANNAAGANPIWQAIGEATNAGISSSKALWHNSKDWLAKQIGGLAFGALHPFKNNTGFSYSSNIK